MLRVLRVAGAVKMAVRAGKAAFEHLEDALVPGRDLVAVDVLKGGTLDAGDVLFVVGTEDIDLLAKQLDHIASRRGADDSHEVRPQSSRIRESTLRSRVPSVLPMSTSSPSPLAARMRCGMVTAQSR